MKICIVGAGIIGVTTAHALARRGHEVTILDAAQGPALGTSHANGGQLSYSYVAPLADASIWKNIPAYLFGSNSPLTLRPTLDLAQWTWLLRFLRACNSRQSARTTKLLLDLAFYSRECLTAVTDELPLDFDFRTAGKLVMLPSPNAMRSAERQMKYQAGFGCEQHLLNVDECVAVEPALEASRQRWAGGVYTPSEQVGDCATFCEQLARQSSVRYGGFSFIGNATVTGAVIRQGKVSALLTSAGEISADTFVMANGVNAARLASVMKFHLPVYPLKGYSITFDAARAEDIPSVSVTDLAKKIVYARLGSRLRVAGRLEIVGHDMTVDRRRIRALIGEAHDLFPTLQAETPMHTGWAGARPATPSGLPFIGKSPLANLYLNTGHGALGWTLACGSAELLASLICGEHPYVDAAPFAYNEPH